jgi:hypothetical protein
MLDAVHHITYVVWDLNSVQSYFLRHFGLEPSATGERRPGIPGFCSYEVGSTTLYFTQPGHPASMEYQLLRRFGGPVISDIGLTLGGFNATVDKLRADGMRFEGPPVVSEYGWTEVDLDPEGSCGMRNADPLFALRSPLPEDRLGIRLKLCRSREEEVLSTRRETEPASAG